MKKNPINKRFRFPLTNHWFNYSSATIFSFNIKNKYFMNFFMILWNENWCIIYVLLYAIFFWNIALLCQTPGNKISMIISWFKIWAKFITWAEEKMYKDIRKKKSQGDIPNAAKLKIASWFWNGDT